MEDALKAALERVPALAVLTFLVIKFLSVLKEQAAMQREHDNNRDEAVRKTVTACQSSIEKSTDVLGKVTYILDDLRRHENHRDENNGRT